ncbi:MAG: hypothetical protein HN817_06420 [Porticoccaceae bacterium]|jgi:glycerophosphoryl diester phosphodiesterase|nr:hypothetical protein [Porticoccaceae bacterium]MBT5578593.1 hypothetical protein [Porticoccaceae bacterium]MBT7375546.1 hypothetical protein [Porticoccaceae bacterium]
MIAAEQLVAHRGYQAKYPENTILSLSQAILQGAVMVELDVQFSADKLPVIYHDTDLKRVSGCSGSLLQSPRYRLIELSAFEPQRFGEQFIEEKISPLESLVGLLRNNPKVTAFVELKEESIAHCGRKLIYTRVQNILQPVSAQVVIMSFDYQLALEARRANWPRVGVVLKQWQDLEHPQVIEARPDFIYTDYHIIPDLYDLRNSPALADTKLVAYEVGNKALAQQLLQRGVDILETFEIESLLTG